MSPLAIDWNLPFHLDYQFAPALSDLESAINSWHSQYAPKSTISTTNRADHFRLCFTTEADMSLFVLTFSKYADSWMQDYRVVSWKDLLA